MNALVLIFLLGGAAVGFMQAAEVTTQAESAFHQILAAAYGLGGLLCLLGAFGAYYGSKVHAELQAIRESLSTWTQGAGADAVPVADGEAPEDSPKVVVDQ
ncbi:MAG: hypothetical protein ACQEXJ_23790 [Myxococcota bacterium]